MGRDRVDRSDAIKRALGGERYQKIADDYGVSRQRVHQWMIAAGHTGEFKRTINKELVEKKVIESGIADVLCETGSLRKACEKVGLKRNEFEKVLGSPKNIACYMKKRNSCRFCSKHIGTYRPCSRRMCKECFTEYNRKRGNEQYHKYHEKRLAAHRKWQQDNPDKVRKIQKRFREKQKQQKRGIKNER